MDDAIALSPLHRQMDNCQTAHSLAAHSAPAHINVTAQRHWQQVQRTSTRTGLNAEKVQRKLVKPSLE
jgi:hypothetical protein